MWFKKKNRKSEDGAEARAEAQWHLEEAESKWPEIREVSESLQRMKKQNNFAKAIENIMRGDAK